MALQPGTHIRDLQINAVLGSGSSSITYRVTDPTIGTQFALKEYLLAEHVSRRADGTLVAKNEVSGQIFGNGLEHFRAEGRLLAKFEHPNIVRILRYFETNGTAYLLMPYYPGQTLDQHLQSAGTLDSEQTRSLMLALMDGLSVIHKYGIIHQDIKPANIYMALEHGPILLDFGVATSSEGSVLPGSKQRGSEGYAALEQSAVDGRIGPWTDIYGFAATLYRCASGIIPPAARARQAALDAGQADPLKPLSQLFPEGQLGGLTDAIAEGLQLLPQDRPRDVGQWQKSYGSLDWRRAVPGGDAPATDPHEGSELLPRILLGIFVLLMVAIGIFLLTDRTPREQTLSPSGVESVSAPAVTGRPLDKPGSEETSRWQAALAADTTTAYRRFMRDFPASVYQAQAQVQLDILDDQAWQELESEDAVAAFEDYLKMFPDGRHQIAAMQGIDSLKKAEAKKQRERLQQEQKESQDWQAALGRRTMPAMTQYITAWPAGKHIEEARRIRRLLQDQENDAAAYAVARKLDTKRAYQAYIDAFPRGASITAALQRLDRLTLRPGKSFKDCASCPAMTVVPGGSYWQGSEDSSALALSMEKPRRLIHIDKPFAVSTFEITMAEWDSCADAGGCDVHPADEGWGRGQRPVILVSWNDAEQYVQWLSDKTGERYRLPSESEWEYFARAGEKSDWPGGDPAKVCDYSNIAGSETSFRWQHHACGDSQALGTMRVGSFKHNAFGLYDVIGNVAEWTADCMNLSYLDAPADGSAWGQGICSSHMTRGGSWLTGTRDIRLPARFNLKNGDRNDFTGFRVVRPIKE